MRGFLGLRLGRAERACAEPASKDAPEPCAPTILPAAAHPPFATTFPHGAGTFSSAPELMWCEGEGSGIGRESWDGQVERRVTCGAWRMPAHAIAPATSGTSSPTIASWSHGMTSTVAWPTGTPVSAGAG